MRFAPISPRILYINDNQDCYNLISRLLLNEKCDYTFSLADSSAEALELIASEPFNLFILENKIPEKNGLELCRTIRKTDKYTPILFFAVKAKSFVREVCLEVGANEFLIKADDSQQVIRVIRKLLNESFTQKSKYQTACFLTK